MAKDGVTAVMSNVFQPANKIAPKYVITSSLLTDYFEANCSSARTAQHSRSKLLSGLKLTLIIKP